MKGGVSAYGTHYKVKGKVSKLKNFATSIDPLGFMKGCVSAYGTRCKLKGKVSKLEKLCYIDRSFANLVPLDPV